LKILFYILIFSSLLSCNEQRRCKIEYSEFKDRKDIPFISVISETISKIEYVVEFEVRHPDTSYSDKAIMYLQDDKFIFKTLNPLSNEFTLFDLNQKINSSRNIELSYKPEVFSKKQNFSVILENKLKNDDDLEVYVYRLKEFFYYNPVDEIIKLDVVVFITKEKGVIGSYISSITEDPEIIIYPSGDILEERIDYSNKRKATLK